MIKGLLFDLNGTLIDILTDEGNSELYRMMANLLDYYGVYLKPEAVRDFFFAHNRTQRRESSEEYPEFDVTAVFAAILDRYGSAMTRAIPEEKRRWLPKFLAETFRAGSRFKLELYSGVRQVLDELHADYRMAAISDGQSLWALPELRRVGLGDDFEFTLVSSDFGFRKPDRRLFRVALDKFELSPSEVIFIGNDMFRDIWGGDQVGMKTVFFQSNQGDWKTQGAEPDYIIYNFSELPEAIRFLTRNES